MSKATSHKRDQDGMRKRSKGGAAYTIREECERLFCETMKTVFLGERDAIGNGSVGSRANAYSPPDKSVDAHHYFSNQTSIQVNSWIEVWDYAGGCSCRGFVAGTGEEISLFVFFDSTVVGQYLKQGLVSGIPV